MRWTIKQKREILETVPFTVEELTLEENGRQTNHPYYRLKTPDWVNVLPITPDKKAVLIKQDRIGPEKSVLEIPGGVVDPDETNDPTRAAFRELEEETGYTSQRLLSLGSINPNPAIQTNRIHFFVALNCQLNPNRTYFPDPEEDIEVVLKDTGELEELVKYGRIDHALSALCILLARDYLT